MNDVVEYISDWFDKAVGYAGSHPRTGILIVVVLLLIMLMGEISDWKWGGWDRPEGWSGNFWRNLLGADTYRFWCGIAIVAAIASAIALYCIYK